VTDQPDLSRQPPDVSARWPFADDADMNGPSAPAVNDVVRALLRPGSPEELQDEGHYLQLYDLGRSHDAEDGLLAVGVQRKPLRTVVIGGWAAAGLAATLVAGVGAAAAFTGTLPHGLQSSAHRYLGVQAPPEDSASASATASATSLPTPALTDSRSRTPPTSPAAPRVLPSTQTPPDIDGVKGRCTAWSNGALTTTSPAYRRLVVDAGGRDQISTYCASALEKPGKAAHTKKAKPPKHPKKSETANQSSKSDDKAKPAPPGHLKK
jgi:hypothetical protein